MAQLIFSNSINTTLRTKLVVAPKGAFERIKNLPFGIKPDLLEPLKISKVNHVSQWDASSQIVFAQYDNKLSRNMGILRADLVEDCIKSHLPSEGDAHVVLVVQNKEEAFVAGIAASKISPLYQKKTPAPKPQTFYIDFHVENGDALNVQELQTLSKAIRNTQRLVDMPCSELNTNVFVQEAQTLVDQLKAQNHPVEIKVIQGEDLKNQGFGGLYGVGKAAEVPPALVVLSYKPSASYPTMALVGKGIVYDTGGLSLKPTSSMCTMKGDMGGAAAVFNAFSAIVENKLKVNVHSLLCLAENAIGPKSFKNDDILYMYSGKTVEVNNTDAEGRLVLADGVSYASKHLNPFLIVDAATLTGAQMITTGIRHAGVLTSNEQVEQKAIKAGKVTGDLVYPMLYAKDILMSQFDSVVADMKNSVKDRLNAQSSCAGHFIESHLDENYKGDYLHVDLAGPAHIKERGTGYGASLLYQLAKDSQ